ncbi:hypothetical protein COEREDRAFT_82271, partial [Coemansia reversa NRRL 1564]
MTEHDNTVCVSDSSDGQENVGYLCPICLQSVVDESYTDPCYHQFCIACLLQWLEHSVRCPLCNGTVVSVVQQQGERIVKTPIGNSVARRDNTSLQFQNRAYGQDQLLFQAGNILGMRKRQAVYDYGLLRISSSNVGERSRRTRISQSPTLLQQEMGSQRTREWIRRDLIAALGINDVEMIESLLIRSIRESGTLEFSNNHPFARLMGDKLELFL